MGEIAEMMLDGTLDCETGEYLGDGPGYPRTAHSFGRDPLAYAYDDDIGKLRDRPPKDTICPVCQKRVRGIEAVHQHLKDKHKIVKKHARESLLSDPQ